MLSIPFQQTARYVKYYGDDVNDQEEEAIRAVLAYDTLAEDYMPGSSDPVKAKYSGNDSALKDYFKAWLQIGLRHPMVYIDAFIHQAYGYLAPVQSSREPIITYDGLTEYADIGISTNDNFFPAIFFETCYTIFGRLPFLNLIITSGAYTWMCMLCVVFLIIRKKYASAVFFVPAFINVLVCLASPQCSSIRYSFQIIAVAPLLLWWTALSLSRNSTSKESPLPE